jgi:hypothetical protein
VVGDQMDGNSKERNDMIEEETSNDVFCILGIGHGFDPFGKLVDTSYNILVPIT